MNLDLAHPEQILVPVTYGPLRATMWCRCERHLTLWQDRQREADEHVELPMFTGSAPRSVLWLTGGILATVLGAVADQLFDNRVIAVIVGAVFAVAFGAVIERMVGAFTKRTGAGGSPSPTQVPVDEIHAGDQGS